MPKKTKTSEQGTVDKDIGQQPGSETQNDVQGAEPDTDVQYGDGGGEFPYGIESDGDIPGTEDGFAADGPDPALDPSLVIPSPELVSAASAHVELMPEDPEPPYMESGLTVDLEDAAASDAQAPAEEPQAAEPTQQRKGTTAARAQGRQAKAETQAPAPTRRVVSIDDELQMQTADEKEAYLWMELRNSQRSKRILTGILDGVERSPNGNVIAVIYYKSQRIVIPASEMFIQIAEDPGRDQKLLNNRHAQILTRSMGAQIDFVVIGLDRRGNSVAASRKEAMLRKQQNFYLPTARNKTPLISEGQVVEARVISVGDKNMRVEAFGVETSIIARDVAWEWVDDCADYYGIGDRVLVKLLSIDTADRHNIRVIASIRDAVANPAQENIQKLNVQGKYIGKVTGVDKRAIYVRLNVGVNAIAIGVHDRKLPSRKDDVSFVVTRIDKEAGVAVGIITRVIKQFV